MAYAAGMVAPPQYQPATSGKSLFTPAGGTPLTGPMTATQAPQTSATSAQPQPWGNFGGFRPMGLQYGNNNGSMTGMGGAIANNWQPPQTQGMPAGAPVPVQNNPQAGPGAAMAATSAAPQTAAPSTAMIQPATPSPAQPQATAGAPQATASSQPPQTLGNYLRGGMFGGSG